MPLQSKSEGAAACDFDRDASSLEELLLKQLVSVSEGIFSVSYVLYLCFSVYQGMGKSQEAGILLL